MNFNFKKKYGQNFISDKGLIKRICSLIDAKEDDLIIEIGPGAGAITSELTQLNSNYIAYEIDSELDEYLSKYTSSKFRIIYDDFLKRDIKQDIKNINYNRLFIVGNLPYYITTPIMLKIIDENIVSYKNVFMVQKEFGDRLNATPGNREYGSITVLMNYFYNVKQEFIVKKEYFNPKPKVDSCILSFNQKDKEDIDITKYKQLVRDAFQFKRKNIRNNLKNYDLELINKVLNKYGFDINSRA
ncbi:MAG: 16S rRNA (adenine(1518)-N(6)/adenine(1519)-N(6))-dimethyltransferase RsmA, partial [Bacilli bacterium]|nr:16S rRNA (adenine(1518)-N(6)/adenine(1519)-N(6))-dimethyltransferase RsmA [Bacilli bacterium]